MQSFVFDGGSLGIFHTYVYVFGLYVRPLHPHPLPRLLSQRLRSDSLIHHALHVSFLLVFLIRVFPANA